MSEPTNPTEAAHLRESFYATRPTPGTVFMRTFLPWQMLRFAIINLRMLVIIGKSHEGQH